MRYAKNKKRSKLICLVVILSIVLAAMLILLYKMDSDTELNVGSDTGNHTETTQNDASDWPDQVQTDGVENVQRETADEGSYGNVEIDTPYLTLYYPEALADQLEVVNTQREPYTLEFYALLEGKAAQRLFDVYLGEGADGNLGAIETEAGTIPIGMTIYVFKPDESWTEDEINTILAMQEVANDLIEQLSLVGSQTADEGPEILDETPEANVTNFMTVRTPFCTLQYPAAWKDYVSVEQMEEAGYKVMFYGQLEGREKKLLFSVIFGGDEGEQLGAVRNDQNEMIPVNLVMEELSLSGWSEEDAATIFAMQEAVNQLIAELPLE